MMVMKRKTKINSWTKGEDFGSQKERNEESRESSQKNKRKLDVYVIHVKLIMHNNI